MIFPAFIFLLLLYRIFFIKNLSNFYFNRHTNRIYYKRNKKLFVCEWPSAQGGFFSRLEFGGRSFSTSFALALKLTSIDKEDPESPITLWVDSNEPSDPRVEYVAQAWEYIRQFMAHGPDNLPPPQAPDWWHVPHNNICLTPRQAFRHYAPWRTGEPGEEKAKQWWMLPFWAVLFPYNLFAALCWWATCRLFNVRPAEAPPEALEGETGSLVTAEMAIRGVRP
ncbi:hypothetical protein PSEWESI4_04928 [Pseudomonas carbonaria]|uniref:Uncharacterized protein n=2 Tax=Zestomonas carbonaria TaxID=2762745 RepID=A0A7U7IBL4_9GAMM|nr:hypothetical protein PSEWESI4_04928 [Pseudomonas carbonaria]